MGSPDSSDTRPPRDAVPSVSVVIPCYNYGHFLGQCLTSVLAQTGVNLRVLVVDDASTDDSALVTARYARDDPRVELLSLPKNVGMIPAVNRGLYEARGDYFVKLDADDLLPPGSLARSIALLEEYPNVGFVYGRPRHFTGKVPPLPRSGRPRWKIWSGSEWLTLRCELGLNCISQPEAVIRSSSLRMVGEYNARLPHTSDLEMWLRLATVSDVGRINGIDQGYYRVHPNSMQRTVNAGAMSDLIGRREAFLSVLDAVGERLPHSAADLEEKLRRKLAVQALDYACWTYDRDRIERELEHELIDFAVSTYPGVRALPEWHRLQKRRQRGRRSRWAPGSLLASVIRRGRFEIDHYRWLRTGV
ncbi:glycosyltransferase involved in cell wall biosynthesis [Nitrobacteraceae bacterium AZCC 1564]